jgi:drug/metabolite transporter (DMT)-like permease
VNANARPHALLRPRVAIPFLIIALIWGSTWWVITTQIAVIPATWAVTWRFALATPAMFALALATPGRIAMPARVHGLAVAVGICQFCGNYNFVYQAERHLTSGIVALMVGLMIVPNALLGRALLKQPITMRFALGSLIAIAGIALQLFNESRVAHIAGNVELGIWLALGAMLAASVSNVIQAGETGRRVPLFTLIAWSMLYGTLCDGALAFWVSGPPAVPLTREFWLGTVYLALAGSVVTFPLYYMLIREIGAGRAAYHNILVVIIAMLLSTLLEGYHWSTLAIGGSAFAVVGLLVALRAKSV